MKKIKLKFTDYYGLKPEDIYYYQILKKHYDVEISETPDYVIDGGPGREHLDYPNSVKIATLGENYAPDFNQFDYALGFDPITFGDRYLRFPLFATYSEFARLFEPVVIEPEKLLRREFCSFVVSNSDGDPLRAEFFHRLSKYKKVLSGGRFLNNVGGRVPDKNAFCASCKFNIAFENSVVPGYTTEKIMQAYAAHSLPIYYGNPTIEEDFVPESMVQVRSHDDVERAVEEIIALDKDDDAYLKRLLTPPSVHSKTWYDERATAFLRHIFDQPLEEARRLSPYGLQIWMRVEYAKLWRLYDRTHPVQMIKKLRKRLRRK